MAHEQVAMGVQTGSTDSGVVLLAGSHQELPMEARSYLEERYQVIKVINGTAALAWLQTYIPDLVIADLSTARLDGYSLCRAIVHNQALTSVSILLLSAGSPEAWLTALQEGADDCMERPIDVRRFGVRVENLVSRSRRIRGRLGPDDIYLAKKGTFLACPNGIFLRRVEDAIDANLDNPEFNVRSLARSMAVGRASLYRQLRMIGNLSPGRLILEHRLQHAALLFTNCHKTVTDVAYTVGFKSLSHFSRSFRKHHGMTPIAYLKAAALRDNPPAA